MKCLLLTGGRSILIFDGETIKLVRIDDHEMILYVRSPRVPHELLRRLCIETS
jgi:hypothetical protein